jgi:hypothetical protein
LGKYNKNNLKKDLEDTPLAECSLFFIKKYKNYGNTNG